MCAVMNCKLPTPAIIRKTVMEGHRWTPKELFEAGIVDELSEASTPSTSPDYIPPVVLAARSLALQHAPLAQTAVYGLVKREMSRKILDAALLDDHGRLIHPLEQAEQARKSLAYLSTIAKL